MKTDAVLPPLILALLVVISFFATGIAKAEAAGTIQDEIFYFVLPDRFQNGDTNNDDGGVPGTRGDNGLDPVSPSYYHGGDFAGLTEKLSYIKSLGATAIWITPPFVNDPTYAGTGGYHGYWILDYTQPDPHLGTKQELKTLIEQAHAKGLKIYFDVVINHTADIIKYEECHDQTTGEYLPGLNTCEYRTLEEAQTNPLTPFVLPGDENLKAPAFLNDFASYNNQGESTFAGESSVYGDFNRLDDLNTKNPIVINGMTDIFKMWIRDYGIDGFRLDTVKHVDVSFWQQWTPAIQAFAASLGKDDFHIFGEVFDGDPRGVSFFTKTSIPSALDFPLYYPTQRVFTGQTPPSDLLFTFDRDDLYTDANTSVNDMLTFISNHDVGRIGYFLNKNLPEASNEELTQRSILAHAFMFFARGVPVIYYGDEQGFTGDGDSALAREDMMPSLVPEYNDNELLGTDRTTAEDNFDRDHPIFETLERFSRLYKRHEALRSGHQTVRYAETAGPGILALSRIGENGREYIIVFNTSTEAQSVTLESTSKKYRALRAREWIPEVVDAEGGRQVTFDLPALSFDIYMAQKKAPVFIEDYAAQLSVPASVNGVIQGELEIQVAVSNETLTPVPQNAVSFEIKIGEGGFESLGTDHTAPYRVFWDGRNVPNGTLVTVRATVSAPGSEVLTSEESYVVDVIEGMDIRFKKPEAWAAANIYFFDSAAPTPDWPGIPMRDHGNDWYSYQFPEGVQSATLIFNDGAGQQTDNLPRNGSGCYMEGAWVGLDSCDLPFIVYFEKPAAWGPSVNIHFWEAGVSGETAWPGNVMTSLGSGWFSYEFELGSESANIIFNDGAGNQTDNLYRESTGCYDIAQNVWADSCERATVVSDAPYGGTGLFVRGDMNGWSTEHPMAYNQDGTYSAVIELAVGRYMFKVADAAWTSGTNFGSHVSETDGSVIADTEKLLQDGSFTNLSITVEAAGSYVFTLDANTTVDGQLLTEPRLTVITQ